MSQKGKGYFPFADNSPRIQRSSLGTYFLRSFRQILVIDLHDDLMTIIGS